MVYINDVSCISQAVVHWILLHQTKRLNTSCVCSGAGQDDVWNNFCTAVQDFRRYHKRSCMTKNLPSSSECCYLICIEPFFYQRIAKGAGKKKGAARKLSKSVENLFDTFWRFLTFFALRENCRKVSKNFLTLFDDFWRFLTWPLSAGPFCNPLILKSF